MFLGKYCLRRPLVFSLVPRCHGLFLSSLLPTLNLSCVHWLKVRGRVRGFISPNQVTRNASSNCSAVTPFSALLPIPGDAIICAAIGAVLRTGWIMTLHPSEGRAGFPYGYLKAVEQHQ